MWRLLFVLSVLFVLALGIRGQGNKRAEDEKAVREVVSKIANTVQDESARTRAALFADDAQIINAFGNKAEGRKEIDEFWNGVFNSGTFSTAKNEEKELKIRFLTPKLALVDRFYIFSGQRGPNSGRELPPRDIHMTLILRKESKGQWLIIYYSVADLRSLPAQKPQEK